MKFAANSSGRFPGRRRSLVGVAVVAVLVGGLATRFVTASSDPAPEAAATAPTPAGQIVTLERRVARNPADLDGWLGLASAYLARAVATADPSDYALAEEAIETAEELRPGDPVTVATRAQLAMSLHEFADALDLGNQARAQLPDNPAVLAVVTDAEVELGRYDDAAVTLQALLDRRPALPALARASYLRQLHGDLGGAIAAMRQAVEAGGASAFDRAAVTSLLGDLYRRSGDLDLAAAAYGQALEGAPGLVAAEVGAAWVRAADGDVDGAVASLEAQVDRYPALAAVLLLADLQRAEGDVDDADDAAELVRAIAVLQEEAGQVVDLEMALFEADEGTDLARAVDLARRAYAARPDNVFVADALAWALFRSGDPAAARPFIDQALRIGTTEPSIRYHAAEIAAAAGDTAAAAEHVRLALVDPWSSFRHHDRLLALADELGVAPPAVGS
jgi:tetratricopeptide (TPR) repeat protein